MTSHNDAYIVGRQYVAEVAIETNFNDPAPVFAATDSIRTLTPLQVEQNRDDRVRKDARRTRSAQEMIEGPRDYTFSTTTYALPRGTNIPADVSALVTAAMGTEQVAGDRVNYIPADVPPSLAIRGGEPDVYSDTLTGAIVEEWKVAIPNGDEPTFEFNGPAASNVSTGSVRFSGTVDGSGAPVNSLALGADTYRFEVGSQIRVGTSGPHTVEPQSNFGANLAITPTITTDEGTDPLIAPYFAWDIADTGGSPVAGVNGSLTIDGTEVLFQEGEFTIKNNWETLRGALDRDFSAAVVGYREVTGSFTFWARRTDIIRLVQSRLPVNSTQSESNIVLVLGNAGAPKWQFTFARAKYMNSALQVPEAEAASFTLEFTALASTASASNNEILVQTNSL